MYAITAITHKNNCNCYFRGKIFLSCHDRCQFQFVICPHKNYRYEGVGGVGGPVRPVLEHWKHWKSVRSVHMMKGKI